MNKTLTFVHTFPVNSPQRWFAVRLCNELRYAAYGSSEPVETEAYIASIGAECGLSPAESDEIVDCAIDAGLVRSTCIGAQNPGEPYRLIPCLRLQE